MPSGNTINATPLPEIPVRGDDSPVQALYLHIPFCFHKCHYCDFYSLADDPDHPDSPNRQSRLTDSLLLEIDRVSHLGAIRPETIFVGGGTPTLLARPLWHRLLEAMRRVGWLGPTLGEFTVEANPETVDADLMSLLARGGVTRVSIGAQSFNPRHLNTLERWHDPANVSRAVTMARGAGIGEINLDLIYAIPGQSLDDLRADLDAVLALEPEHIAAYSLTFEPDTPLTAKLRLGRISAVGEDLELAMFNEVNDRLETAGYERYEISNFARVEALKPGAHRCRHNLHYWHNRNWLGLGPGAASHVDGHRFKNEPHLGRYCSALERGQRPPRSEDERLPAGGSLGERLMLGLRLRAGLDWGDLEPRLADQPRRAERIAGFIQAGLLERTPPPGARLRLTERGTRVADAVLAQLL